MTPSHDRIGSGSSESSSTGPSPIERRPSEAHGGEPQAFNALFEQVTPVLYAWASIRVRGGTLNHVDAHDIVQEVWLRAVRAFTKFDVERAPFRSWILGIARNVLLDFYRAQGQRAQIDPIDSAAREAIFSLRPESVTTVSARLSRDEGLQGFLTYARELEDLDRKILLLCCFEDHSCAEAAVRVGLNVEAVTKRWQRLRARLAESPRVQAILAQR